MFICIYSSSYRNAPFMVVLLALTSHIHNSTIFDYKNDFLNVPDCYKQITERHQTTLLFVHG